MFFCVALCTYGVYHALPVAGAVVVSPSAIINVRNASALVADQNEPASGAAGLLAKARGDYRKCMKCGNEWDAPKAPETEEVPEPALAG